MLIFMNDIVQDKQLYIWILSALFLSTNGKSFILFKKWII